MSRATTPCPEAISTSTPSKQPGVLVTRRHHLLVRWSHWLNVPILLGLILSGISIYWASPIYQHKPDPITGNFDLAADIGEGRDLAPALPGRVRMLRDNLAAWRKSVGAPMPDRRQEPAGPGR